MARPGIGKRLLVVLDVIAGVVLALLAAFGLISLLVLAFTNLSNRDAWCVSEQCTVQAWLVAAGSIGVVLTLVVLWRTLRHMRRSSEQQLRAYLYITESQVENFAGPAMRIRLKLKNMGQTPAYTVTANSGFVVGDPAIIDIPNIERALKSFGDIGAGQEKVVSMFWTPEQTSDIRAAFAAGAWHLYAIGTIAYTDAFGRAQRSDYQFEATTAAQMEHGELVISTSGNRST